MSPKKKHKKLKSIIKANRKFYDVDLIKPLSLHAKKSSKSIVIKIDTVPKHDYCFRTKSNFVKFRYSDPSRYKALIRQIPIDPPGKPIYKTSFFEIESMLISKKESKTSINKKNKF